MTDKEKLEKAVKLADAMYYAAQNLTTDASRLRNAMDEYHQFIITEYNKQEPASDDLEQASKEWLRPQLDKSYADYGERKMMELTHFDGYAMLDAVEFGAQWDRKQMMEDAVEAVVSQVPCANEIIFRNPASVSYWYLPSEMNRLGINKGDKVKVIIIKK